MDAATRFTGWVRSAPFAAMTIAAGLAGGCSTPPVVPTNLDPGEPIRSGRAGDPGWADRTRRAEGEYRTTRTDSSPVARPQAPGEPVAPAAPIVPLSVGPTAATPAPVAPFVPVEVPAAPGATPAPVVSATPAAAGGGVSPVVAASSVEPDASRAATQVRVVAVIGTDVVITDDEVWQVVRQQAGEYARLTGAARDAKEKEMFRKSLRVVIERELIIADFLARVRKNKPALVEEIKDQAATQAAKRMRSFKQENKFPSEEAAAAALRSQGLSLKALQRQWERGAIENMYISSSGKDIKNKVGLAEIEQHYRTHPDDFKVEDRALWLDLFLSYSRFNSPDEARKQAEIILAKAKAGEPFADLVLQHGHGDSKLRKGLGAGEVRGEISPPELEPVVFGLAEGQVSGVVPTEFGLHVVKVTDRVTAGVRPFDEKTQTEIKGKLIQAAMDKDRSKLIEELWRKTTVKVVELP